MTFQTLPQSNFASSFGESVGKGLNEYIPQEINRLRTRNALLNLEQQKNLTPFQQMAHLATVPGIDSNLMNSLLPYVQNQLADQEQERILNPGANGMGTMQGAMNPSNPSNAMGAPSEMIPSPAPNLNDWGRAEEIRGELNPVRQRALYLRKTAPFKYSPSQADAQAEKDVADLYSKADHALMQAFTKQLPEIISDLGPTVYENFRQNLESAYARNPSKSIESLVRDPVQQLRKYNEDRISLEKVGTGYSIFNRPDKEKVKGIRDIGKRASELGVLLPDFITQIQKSQDVNEGEASYIAQPPSNEIRRKIDAIKQPPLGGFMLSKQAKKVAADIGKNLKNTDNIGSIAFLANRNGIPIEPFLGEISRNANPNALTDFQKRQLREGKALMPGTFHNRTLSGLLLLSGQ